MIAVGTPSTTQGEVDLSQVESVAREIASSITSYKVVIGKSTIRFTPATGFAGFFF